MDENLNVNIERYKMKWIQNEKRSENDKRKNRRKDVNKFIEQKSQGINKIGSGGLRPPRSQKGGGGLRPPPPLLWKAYFVYALDILFNEFIQVLSLLFLFPFAYHPRESLFHLWMIEWMNEWFKSMNEWLNEWMNEWMNERLFKPGYNTNNKQ